MEDDDFEWDAAKAAANLTNHGVSFERARLVFADPFAVGRLTIARIIGRTGLP